MGKASILLMLSLRLPVLAATATGFTGPYEVVMDRSELLAEHTIFRPAELGKVKGKLPVVIYGNGGCLNIGNMSENFLGEVASYGFIVTAPGPVLRNGVRQQLPPGGLPAQSDTLQLPLRGQPPQTAGRRPEGQSGEGAARMFADLARMQSKPDQMKTVLDWIARENAAPASIYRQKLDEDRIAVMGGSCGGLQAIAAAPDPRVKTLVVLNSGIIRTPQPGSAASLPNVLLPGTEEDLRKIHSPTIYLIGGPKDVAYPNAQKDFEIIEGVPLFYANIDAGHEGTWQQARGGAMGRVAAAWLRWQLQGDREAARMFEGPQCGLCADPQWTVKKKNMK